MIASLNLYKYMLQNFFLLIVRVDYFTKRNRCVEYVMQTFITELCLDRKSNITVVIIIESVVIFTFRLKVIQLWKNIDFRILNCYASSTNIKIIFYALQRAWLIDDGFLVWICTFSWTKLSSKYVSLWPEFQMFIWKLS